MSELKEIVIEEITNSEAMALAQFAKRIGWTGMREQAVSDDETYLIKAGIYKLQDALSRAGYSPR